MADDPARDASGEPVTTGDSSATARKAPKGAAAAGHPWYRDGTPSAVYSLIKRYREEITDGRRPRERAVLLYEIGRLFEEHLGDSAQAFAHYKEAGDADPEFVPILRALRRLSMRRGAWPGALDLIDREMALATGEADVAALRRERAEIVEHRLGRADAARSDWSKAVRGNPNDGMALRSLVTSLRRAGDWPALRDALSAEAHLSTSPEMRRAILFEIARLDETTLDDLAAADAGYRAAVEGGEAEPAVRAAAERIAWRTGRWSALVSMLAEDAASLDGGGRADILYQIGRISVDRLGDRHRARVALEEARTIRPDSQLVLRELLRVYESVGAWQEAITTLRALAALTDGPRQKVLLLHRLGQMLLERLDLPDDAIVAWRQALEIDGTFGPVLQAAGDLLARSARWEDLLGMHMAEAAAQADAPRKAMALYRAGELLHRRLGRTDEAIGRFEEAAGASAGFVPALRALESIYRRGGRARDLADLYGRLAESASEPAVKVGYLERRAAVLEHDLGDVEGAIVPLDAILELVPNHVAAGAALTRIYEDRKEWEKLIALLRRLAERDGSEEGAAAHALRIGDICERILADPKRALAEYEAALAANPRYLPAMRAAGRILHQERRWEDLVALYRREQEVTESPVARAAILYRIGVICEEQIGAVDKAARALHEAFVLDPTSIPVIHTLIRIHLEHRNIPSVVELLEAEAVLYTDPRQRAAALHRIGELWEDPLGKEDLALDCYARALELDPDLGPARAAQERLLARTGAWESLADLVQSRARPDAGPDDAYREAVALGILWRENVGNLAKAAEQFRKALEIRPDAAAPLRALADAYAATSQWGPLTEVLDRLAKVLPDDQVRMGYLRERMREADRGSEDVEVRVQIADEMLRLAPDDRELALKRESIAAPAPGDAAIDAILEAEAARDGGSEAERSVALYRLADCKARRGDLAAAVEIARRAVEADPSSMPAVVLWTSLAEARDGKLGAEHLIRLAKVSSNPAARMSYLLHAAESLSTGGSTADWEGAADLLSGVLRESPGSVEVTAALVRLYGSRHEWKRLAEVLGDVAEEVGDRPEGAEVLYMLATVQRDRLQLRRDAITTLNRILRVAPSHAPALTDLADLYAEEDLFNEAINIYRHLLRTDADEASAAEAAVRLATLLEDKLQDVAAAREVLDEATARFPKAPVLLERLATQCKLDRRWDEARRILEDLVSRDDAVPKRVGHRILLAGVLVEGFSDHEGAAAVLRSAMAEEKGTARALERLVRLLSDRRDWKALAALLEDHVASLGEAIGRAQAPFLVELAKVCSQYLDDDARAVSALERAAVLDPANRVARLKLGDLYVKAGNKEAAVGLARDLLAEDPLYRGAWGVLAEAGEPSVAGTAARVLLCLGAGGDRPGKAAEIPKPRKPSDLDAKTVTVGMLRRLLVPPVAEPAAEFVALAAPSVGALYASDVETHGAVKRDRIRGTSGFAAAIDAVSRALGLPEVAAYFAPIDVGRGVIVEPEAKPVLVIPSDLQSASPADRLFHVGRALGKIALGLHLLDKLSAADLAILVDALAQLVQGGDRPSGGADGGLGGPVAELASRLDRDLPRRTRRTMEPVLAAHIERPMTDCTACIAAAERSADRIGLVLSDALETALRFAARRDLGDSVAADAGLLEVLRKSGDARDLLLFAVSPERLATGL